MDDIVELTLPADEPPAGETPPENAAVSVPEIDLLIEEPEDFAPAAETGEPTDGTPAAELSEADENADAEAEEKRQRSKNRFQFGFLLYAAIFLVIGAVALLLLWNFLGDYETSLPETAINGYIDRLPDAFWEDAIREKIGGTVSAFESEDEIAEKTLSAILHGKRTIVRKTSEGSDEEPVYRVMIGGKELLTMQLTPAEELSFGLTSWKVKDCTLNREKLPTGTLREYRWTVPVRAVLTVNGRRANIDNVYADNLTAREVSDLEPKTKFRMTTYRAMLYVKPDVTVELDGELLENAGGGYYAYPDALWKKDFRVTAPSAVTVYVNGVELTKKYAVSTVHYAATDLEKTPSATYTVYELPALSEAPTVTAEAGGKTYSLKCASGMYTLDYPKELSYTVTVNVPAGTTLTVNGRALDLSYRTVQNGAISSLSPHKKFLNPMPTADVYVLSGLFDVPVITAQLGGKVLLVTPEPVSEETPRERVYNVSAAPTAEKGKTCSDVAQQYFKAYMTYVLQGSRQLDAHYDAVLALTSGNVFQNFT